MSESRKRWWSVLRARVQAAVAAPRPTEVALAVTVAVAVFIYVPLRLSVGANLTSIGGVALGLEAERPPTVQDVDPDRELMIPSPPYAAQAGAGSGGNRNLFDYGPLPTPPPPPPTPTPAPRAPTPPPPPPAPTPTPYSAPFKLIGLAEQLGRRIAFLKAGEQLYVALEGDVLEVKSANGVVLRHRIEKIGLETVDVGPRDFEAQAQKLKLGS